MNFYVVSIVQPCTEDKCDRNATVVVRNSRNEEIRKCCTYHGNRLARKLNDAEAKKTTVASTPDS